MRPLTIGVLIVVTGTLAALPFRNPPTDGPVEPPTRSPESGPHRALVADSWPDRPSESRPFETPPTVSPLSRSARRPPERSSSVPVSDRPVTDRGNAVGDRSTANDFDGRESHRNRFATARPARDASPDPVVSEPNAPSGTTYEDWMIPVDDSQLIRERFSATIAADRSAPRWLPDRSADRPEDQDASAAHDSAAYGADVDTRPTAALPASLKSNPPGATDSDATARPRHWIRQPG